MRKYITVHDIKSGKGSININSDGSITMSNLPIYQIVDSNEKNYTYTIEDIKTKERYQTGVGNIIRVSE